MCLPVRKLHPGRGEALAPSQRGVGHRAEAPDNSDDERLTLRSSLKGVLTLEVAETSWRLQELRHPQSNRRKAAIHLALFS